MKKISRCSFLQVAGLLAATAALTACGGKTETVKKDDTHEVITFMAPYMEEEAFIEQVHSVYPEVNIEIVPYSGDNTTTCLQNMFEANDLPDICTLTVYDPMTDHVSDKLLDLSGYDFTDNYVESRLQEVSDNGAIYLLPSSYNCYGITYNKTLLREHGWENTIVTTGTKMLDFIKGDATMEDVIRQMDEDQDSVVNNTPDTITTVTEELSQEDCAMLVGRCFAQATGSDLALVSLSTWIPGNPTDQNHHGVAAKLYAKGITDYDLSVILPTGWNRTIQTVTLTGQQINDLLATGYDAYGNGKGYPYVMASPVQPEADKAYQVAICGVSDQLAAEADVVDSGVVGMDAAKAFFGAYTSISRADTAWS